MTSDRGALLRAEELNGNHGGQDSPPSPEIPEEWRAIPSTDGLYEASSLGQVRRAAGSWYRDGEPLVLAQRATSKGYRIVDVTIGGRSLSKTVHRLVCAAFHGPADGRQVDHKNFDRADNRASNLEWVSCAENMRRAWARRARRLTTPELTGIAAALTVEAERRAVAS